MTTVDTINLITAKRVKLPPAEHLFITIEGTASIEGATLGDDDQMLQARPTLAVWVRATTDTDVAIHPDSNGPPSTVLWKVLTATPKTNVLQTLWTTAKGDLSDVTLDETLTPQTMGAVERAIQIHHSTAQHTVWHYSTTIHPEAVTQIEQALSLDFSDSHNAHPPGALTTF